MGFVLNLLVGASVMLAALSIAPGLAMSGNEGIALAAAGDIIISELMYDPYLDEATEEWVELHNPGAASVNMANWTVSDSDGGVDFVFPNIEFPAGGYALVRICAGTNSTAFVDGNAVFFMHKSSAIWPASGDNVLLSDGGGQAVDFMSYGAWDASDMDPAPAGFNYTHSNASAEEGFSLALAGGEWRQSVPSPLEPNGDDLDLGLLISAVGYNPYQGNEFIGLANPLSGDVDISGCYLSDGESFIAFPEGTVLVAGCSLAVSRDPVAFTAQSLCAPEFEYQEIDSTVPDMLVLTTVPVLSNDGDEVFLFNRFGTMLDAFTYGESDYSGEGWSGVPAAALKEGQVARRARDVSGFVDTNTSSDWDSLRPYYIGQSDFAVETFTPSGGIVAFASPDSSFEAVSGAVNSAASSIWLSIYELTSQPLALCLASAAMRGVEVRVFLEGAPVGGITEAELYLARKIVEAGGQVRIMTSDSANDIYDRYDYVHSKYAVIDGKVLLITSENWGETGIPLNGTSGNRGWGALVDDAGTAAYFADVFEDDWNPLMPDSMAFDSAHPSWGLGVNATYEPGDDFVERFGPVEAAHPGRLTPVLSPDTSLSQDTILGMLGSATERVMVEEFYIYKHWGSRTDGSVEETPNLYLEAVIDAARRGCEVKVLLDSTYYNTDSDDPIDNDDTVEYVNSIAAGEDLDLEAKLINLDQHNLAKIHNKGVIADDSVLISSINWNLNSVTRNRETGLIIESVEVADYFAGIFEYDWIDDTTAPFAHFFAADEYMVNTTVRLNASTSSDNVGIVNYTWALDGAVVSYGIDFARFFGECGPHILNLTVADAWGNTDSFQRAFNITETAPEPDDGEDDGNITGDGDELPGDDSEDEDDGNTTADTEDDSYDRMLLVLLLLPVLFFIAVLAAAAAKRRR